jgi:Holliday junction DNA helicase RuvA
MISFLQGKVQEKTPQGLILNVNGVGYEVLMSTNCLSKMPMEGKEASVFTYLHVREDLMQLFGFSTKAEKELFEQLISVSGIGPKVALAILSAFSVSTLKKAILSNDVDLITAIPGIGKKSAQRLILELKEKLSLPELEVVQSSNLGDSSKSAYSEARAALISLGYSATEATEALEAFPYGQNEITVEELIKYALKNLAGG